MASLPLITPSDCAVVLVDYQAGLAFAAGSADRQGIRSAALALEQSKRLAVKRKISKRAMRFTESSPPEVMPNTPLPRWETLRPNPKAWISKTRRLSRSAR